MLDFGKSATGFTLDARQRLPVSMEEVFPFFAEPRNLEALTPAFLHFEILAPAPTELKAGALIDYRIKLRGIPVTWRTRIAAWEPPTYFVDEQLRGPYLAWRHEHRFERDGDGTLVIDHVDYRVPGGALMNALFVRPDLRRIFSYRREQLEGRFGRAT